MLNAVLGPEAACTAKPTTCAVPRSGRQGSLLGQTETFLTTEPWSACEWIADTQLTRASVLLGFRFYIAEIRPVRATVRGRAIPCSNVAQQRQKIIRKTVALRRDESVSVVTVGIEPTQTGDPTHARLYHWQ